MTRARAGAAVGGASAEAVVRGAEGEAGPYDWA